MAETAIARPDPLDDVLAVERELAELMGSERLKAARWLEERKHEIDRDAEAELARAASAAREDEEAAKSGCAKKAEAVVEQSIQLAERLAALDDAQLTPLVRKHLAAIVPGGER